MNNILLNNLFSTLKRPDFIYWLCFILMVLTSVMVGIEYPFLWFDESTFISLVKDGVSLTDLILPGVIKHYYGGQSLLFFFCALILKLFYFVPVVYIFTAFNIFCFFGIFLEGKKILDFKTPNHSTYFIASILIFINAILFFYINDFKPYLFEAYLSLYFFTKFYLNEFKKKSIFHYLFVFWFSLQASLSLLVVSSIYIFYERDKKEIVKLLLLLGSALIYLVIFKINHPNFMPFMEDYWIKQRAMGWFGWKDFFHRVEVLFLAGLPFKNIYAFLFSMGLFVYGYNKERKFTIYLLLIYLFLLCASLLKKYPVTSTLETGIDLNFRTILFLSPLVIFYLAILSSYLSKNLKVLYSIVIITFCALTFAKRGSLYKQVVGMENDLQFEIRLLNEIKQQNRFYCIFHNANLLYTGNLKAKLIKPRIDFINFDEFISNEKMKRCNLVVYPWDRIHLKRYKNLVYNNLLINQKLQVIEISKVEQN